MRVEYRNMLPEDEDAVFDLRLQMWGGPSREYARQGAYLDPLYSQHTFLAMRKAHAGRWGASQAWSPSRLHAGKGTLVT